MTDGAAYLPSDLCAGGHPFVPGRCLDTPEQEPGDPRWCNVCGEARGAAFEPSSVGRSRTWECGDPYGGIGCAEPGCTHDPLEFPLNATMHEDYKTPRGQRKPTTENASRQAAVRGEVRP